MSVQSKAWENLGKWATLKHFFLGHTILHHYLSQLENRRARVLKEILLSAAVTRHFKEKSNVQPSSNHSQLVIIKGILRYT